MRGQMFLCSPKTAGQIRQAKVVLRPRVSFQRRLGYCSPALLRVPGEVTGPEGTIGALPCRRWPSKGLGPNREAEHRVRIP